MMGYLPTVDGEPKIMRYEREAQGTCPSCLRLLEAGSMLFHYKPNTNDWHCKDCFELMKELAVRLLKDV